MVSAPKMKESNLEEDLKKIRDEIIGLKKSPLYSYRTKNKYLPVIGEGNHNANIMFVGEAPGRNEAETGRPFCGAAGKILDELLQSIGLSRKEVYITNIVKDRPPENRDPLPEEISVYAPFLDRQISLIKPRIIVTLGRFSMNYVLNKFGILESDSISRLHGRIFEASADYGQISICVFYHPAAAIYNNNLKETLFSDFKILKNIL